MYLTDVEYLHLFWRYLPPNFKVIRNRAKFCMFWPLKFFGGKTLKILDRNYKIQSTIYHRAKFCADWPTPLGDFTLKGKKVICGKTKVRFASYHYRAD